MQDAAGHTQSTLDTTAPRPNVPLWAVVLLIVWSAVEGTVFAFALRPTMNELLLDLAGFTANPVVLVVLLSILLTVIVAGSFASIQALNDAIQAKHIGTIMNMILVQASVAVFQVLFLYRELIDATAPWLAQQGVVIGAASTVALASMMWIAVRGMTWFLFAHRGAPALSAVLMRQAAARRPDVTS
jgi:hypothetical protein